MQAKGGDHEKDNLQIDGGLYGRGRAGHCPARGRGRGPWEKGEGETDSLKNINPSGPRSLLRNPNTKQGTPFS